MQEREAIWLTIFFSHMSDRKSDNVRFRAAIGGQRDIDCAVNL